MTTRTGSRKHFRFWRNKYREDAAYDVLLPRRPRRRWLRTVLLIAVPLTLLLWFLPAIAAHSPLLPWLVSRALAGRGPTVEIGSASLGWFSPIELQQVVIGRPNEKPAAEIPRIVSSKSLFGLITDRAWLGSFRLERPRIAAVWRKDGSNWEDILAPWMKSTEPSEPVALEIQIVDGTIEWIDHVRQQSRQIESVEAVCALSRDRPQLIDVRISGRIADREPGTFEAKISMRQTESGQFSLTTKSLPLALADAPLLRFSGGWQIAGRLDGAVLGQWGGSAEQVSAQADMKTRGFALKGEPLKEERIALNQLELVVRTEGKGHTVEIPRAEINSELGQIDLSGNLDLSKFETVEFADALLAQQGELRGQLDLARLAALLPGTLRIRPETKVTSGKVEMSLQSQRVEQCMQWTASAHAANFVAEDRGREIRWDKPISMRIDARQSPRGFVIDLLSCESDFLRVNAAGDFDDLAGNAQFELEKLVKQLEHFVDLTDFRLNGQGWARGRWKKLANGDFDSTFDLEVVQLGFRLPSGTQWNEPNLSLAVSVRGRTDWTAMASATRIDRFDLEARTATENLIVRTTAPVVDIQGAWPLDLRFAGKLDSLLGRAASFVPIEPWQATGTVALSAAGSVSAEGVHLRDLRATGESVKVTGPWLDLAEQKIELTAAGSWQKKSGQVSVPTLTLASSALTARGENWTMSTTEGKFAPSGQTSFQADLARIASWFPTKSPNRPQVAGTAVGMLKFASPGTATRLQFDTDINQLTIRDRTGVVFNEPRIQLAAAGDWDRSMGVLRIERGELASSAVSLGMGGTLTTTATTKATTPPPSLGAAATATTPASTATPATAASLSGACNYDLDRLTLLMRPYIGSQVQFSGRHSAQWNYQGGLNPAEARGEIALPWQSALLFGFPIGAGTLRARLGDGWITCDPCELSVSGGKVVLAPRVSLGPKSELLLPAGKCMEQVHITPEMCARAMMYALPVLADVTEVQGSFSLELEGARIPLDDPAQSDIAGRILIHSIDVGPGPLIRELALLLGRAVPGKLRRESVVPFRMVQGRVYHQGMELIFPDITIRTQGSVGLDQSLALLIEMPPPPKWIEPLANTPAAAALKNQTLRIPLAGTLSRPALDRKAVDDYNRQFIRNAAGNVIDDVLNRQLDRLLNPPKR